MSVFTLQQSVIPRETAAVERAAKVLAQTMQTAGQYAVEIDKDDAEPLREHLAGLVAQAEHALPGEYDALHSSFRGELRAYREKCLQSLGRMREQMAAAVATVQSMTEGVYESGEHHQEQVRAEMAKLKACAATDDLAAIRQTVVRSSAAVVESCQHMQQANRVLIMQLRDEVRVLHQEVAKERRAALTDAHTGAWNRAKLDAKIRDLILVDQPFCVFFIGVSNLVRLLAQHPPERLRAALQAMLRRLSNLIPEDALPGRWNEDVFAVIFDVPRAVVAHSPAYLQAQLSGAYSIEEDGATHTVDMAVKVSVVERAKGASDAEFYPRVGQAALAVAIE